MATLKNTTINDTGFLTLPSGTTAQRPASPAAGMIRLNTSTNVVEIYANGAWNTLYTISLVPTVYQSATLYAELNNSTIYSLNSISANTVTIVDFASYGTDEVNTSLTVLKSTASGCKVTIPQGDPGSSFSVSVWYRSNSGSSVGMLFSKYQSPGGSYGNDIWDGGGGGGIYLNNGDGQGNPYANAGSYNFKSTSWQLWTLTWNGSTAYLYINGSLIGAASTYRTFSGYTGPWSLGSWAGGYFGDYALSNARFRKFAVFPTALTSGEVSALYSAGI